MIYLELEVNGAGPTVGSILRSNGAPMVSIYGDDYHELFIARAKNEDAMDEIIMTIERVLRPYMYSWQECSGLTTNASNQYYQTILDTTEGNQP